MSDEKKPFNNPFGALASIKSSLPRGQSAPSKVKPPPKPPERCVVRLERAGRRGKEVTVLEKLGLPPAEREKWLKELKNALGCGGVIEEDTLVLQGDQRERAKAWLIDRGIGKVTIGN